MRAAASADAKSDVVATFSQKKRYAVESVSIVAGPRAASSAADDEPTTADFNLSDNIYTKATLDISGKVCLWLGANVMLEYSYDEDLEMLNRNLAGANQKLENCTEDLQFLRDQIITSEVNMARVFNYDVKRRRELKEKEAKERSVLEKQLVNQY